MPHARLHTQPHDGDAKWPFSISETTVKSDNTLHPVLVITPRAPMVLGVERIEALRKPVGLSAVDRYLIEQTRLRGHRVHLLVFRAANDLGERLWSFDPQLSSSQVEELGYLVTKALLPVHRRMMANGVALLAHTDWGTRECYAMRCGVRRLLTELEQQPHPSAALTDVDRWVLRNMCFHFALGIEHVTKSLLPNQIRMIERRWARVSDLVTRLPRNFLD